jgi:hypothetical protein
MNMVAIKQWISEDLPVADGFQQKDKIIYMI